MTPEEIAKQVYAEMQTNVRQYIAPDIENGHRVYDGCPAKVVSEPDEAAQIEVIAQAIRDAEERGRSEA